MYSLNQDVTLFKTFVKQTCSGFFWNLSKAVTTTCIAKLALWNSIASGFPYFWKMFSFEYIKCLYAIRVRFGNGECVEVPILPFELSYFFLHSCVKDAF